MRQNSPAQNPRTQHGLCHHRHQRVCGLQIRPRVSRCGSSLTSSPLSRSLPLRALSPLPPSPAEPASLHSRPRPTASVPVAAPPLHASTRYAPPALALPLSRLRFDPGRLALPDPSVYPHPLLSRCPLACSCPSVTTFRPRKTSILPPSPPRGTADRWDRRWSRWLESPPPPPPPAARLDLPCDRRLLVRTASRTAGCVSGRPWSSSQCIGLSNPARVCKSTWKGYTGCLQRRTNRVSWSATEIKTWTCRRVTSE